MKLSKCFLALGLFVAVTLSIPLRAQTDVTSLYLKNPSFESRYVTRSNASGNIVNATFDTVNNFTGWSEGFGAGGTTSTNAECYNKTFDVHQDIEGLDAGIYRVSVSGFYRQGTAVDDYSLWTAGTLGHHAKIYAQAGTNTAVEASIMSICEGMVTTGLGGATDVVGGSYVPTSMEAANYWMAAGYYAPNEQYNSVIVTVAEGEMLRIGVKKGTAVNGDWAIFDNFKLEKCEAMYTPQATEPASGYPVTELEGWTVTGGVSNGYHQQNIVTDNATATHDANGANSFGDPGTPTDGAQALYLREGWCGGNGTKTILQSVTLPAGVYTLSVDSRIATNGGHRISLKAGAHTVELPYSSAATLPAEWSTTELDFIVSETTTIDVGLSLAYVNNVSIAAVLDNMHLTKRYDLALETELDVNVAYYFYNTEAQQFICFGGDWGSYYVMGEAGEPMTVSKDEDCYELATTLTQAAHYFYTYSGNPWYAFGDGNNQEDGQKWFLYSVGTDTDGKKRYVIENKLVAGHYLSATQDTHGARLKTSIESDTFWKLYSYDELRTAYPPTADGDRSSLIRGADFWRLAGGYSTENNEWKVFGQYNLTSDYSDTNNDAAYQGLAGIAYAPGANVTNSRYSFGFSQSSDMPHVMQTITGIPAGVYVVEAQAAFRDGNFVQHTEKLTNHLFVPRAFLFANSQKSITDDLAATAGDYSGASSVSDKTAVRAKDNHYSIYDGAQLVPIKPVGTEGWWGNHKDHVEIWKSTWTDGVYSTFDIEIGKALIRSATETTSGDYGKYQVRVPVVVTDDGGGLGKLTLGVAQELGIQYNELFFDRFRLRYLGNDAAAYQAAIGVAKETLTDLNANLTDKIKTAAAEKSSITSAIAETAPTSSDVDALKTQLENYTRMARELGESAINQHIYDGLKADKANGLYASSLYPYAGTAERTAFEAAFGETAPGTVAALRDAIEKARLYIQSNAEARIVEENLRVYDKTTGDADTKQAAVLQNRNARKALVYGTSVTDMFTGTGGRLFNASANDFTGQNLDYSHVTVVIDKGWGTVLRQTKNHFWSPRDVYSYLDDNQFGDRYFEYVNYWAQRNMTASYKATIQGLPAGKYIFTIAESHNDWNADGSQGVYSVEFTETSRNAGGNVVNRSVRELIQDDMPEWGIWTHHWQDVWCTANISSPEETVEMAFTAKSANTGTFNVTNLRIYRIEDAKELLLDEDHEVLAKRLDYENAKLILRRSMNKNKWNTLVLPVDLTTEQLRGAFGDDVVVAKAERLMTGVPTTILFRRQELKPGETAIEAGEYYLVKPFKDPDIASGSATTYAYVNSVEDEPDNTQDVAGPVYFIDGVSYTRNPNTAGEPRLENEGEIVADNEGYRELSGEAIVVNSRVQHAPPAQSGQYFEHETVNGGIGDSDHQENPSHNSIVLRGSYVATRFYVPVESKDDDGNTLAYYAFKNDGLLYHLMSDSGLRPIKGFRWWIVDTQYSADAVANEAHVRYYVDDELLDAEAVTGIENVAASSVSLGCGTGIYDLQGRRLNESEWNAGHLRSGIYIVNGQKIMVK